ncbi:MAG: DRTGG domain-containing protein [Clostridium sp.]|uniref:DRTGG domain-containing protein n=1 Tax=Clostridium sp. TaxID=1506 RepID=UPI002FCA3DBB
MSKHQEVIAYIKGLEEGTRISVRSVAEALGVSEGTAYKAIKEAEKQRIVTTIARVGTVRIDRIDKRSIENLTCSEVASIVTGTVLGGKGGLYKSINNFVIGAMTIDAMGRYLCPSDLLITGNRDESHRLALEKQCAVLITGGFSCTDEVKRLADKMQLPVISCQYDTFTTATLINNAISQRQIKSDIILAEDIMKADYMYLDTKSTIGDLKSANIVTSENKFYVVDDTRKLVGSIVYEEGKYNDDSESILPYVEKNIIGVNLKTSISYAGHLIIREELGMLPVLEGKRLVGVLLREDIEKALRNIGHKQSNNTIEDLLVRNFEKEKVEKGLIYKGTISPEMLGRLGMASWSVLNFILSTTGIAALRAHKIYNIVVDSFNVVFIKPLQLESEITCFGEIIDISRNSAKVEISLRSENELIGRGYLVCKMLGK